MNWERPEYERLIGWLMVGLFAVGALQSLVFYSSAELYRRWLEVMRRAGSPLASPWSFVGLQVVAAMGLVVSWRLASRARKRAMYYFAFWTSLMGFWWYLRIENLLGLFGISVVLMVLTLIDLKRDRPRT